MNTKLTLRLDDDLIKFAKKYAAIKGKSVSRIVADLFEIIKNEKFQEKTTLPPGVRSLRGVLSHSKVEKKDYGHYLEEKYL